MYSLRKAAWLVFLVTAVLLSVIIFLGLRQYLVAGRYTRVIDEKERMLFQYSTVRESITEALIDRDAAQLGQSVPELEKLNSTLLRLQENPMVPAEFKLALVNKIDIAGLVIAIRGISGEGDFGPKAAVIQEDLRTIADHLLKYDRIIVSQARARMVDLQMVIIGSMGLFISIVCFLLILLYRNSVQPMLHLTRQLQDPELTFDAIGEGLGASREVAALADAIQEVQRQVPVREVESSGETDLNHIILADTVNETTNQLNGIINYAQILLDDASDILTQEQKELLEKIMETGAAMARSWKNIQ